MDALTKDIEKKIEELAEPICAELGVELWAVEFVKEAGYWYLRVYVDKDGAVTINDCEAVSRKLEIRLDLLDFIEPAYMLEVSSPGADRMLTREGDFARYAGEYVDIKLYKALDKVKVFRGKLRGLSGEVIAIETDDGALLEFPRATVASCRLAILF